MVDGSYFFTPTAILVGVVSRRRRFRGAAAVQDFLINES